MDFKQIFDVNDLDDYTLGHLEYVLNSSSYDAVFRPYLEKMRTSAQHKMLDRSQARKDAYPDDFLAGCVITVDGFLAFCDQLVLSTRMERIAAARAQSPEEQYDRDLMAGRVRSAGQQMNDT